MSEGETNYFGQFGNELQSKHAKHFYSDSEVESLIDDLTIAAKEAIEQAGADAAKAAALAALERQAELLQEKAEAMREAELLKEKLEMTKREKTKNMILSGIICFLGGLAVGITGAMLMSN